MTTRTARKQPTRNPSTVRAVPKPLTYRVIIRRAEEQELMFTAWGLSFLLTFLAGAELDPAVLRTQWKETTTVGLVAFFAPFLGCAAAAYWLLHWSVDASWLAGIALSTTSVAVVYAVMLEFGLNRTRYRRL